MSRNGKELCYDTMKDPGSACCLCSLPLNVMRRLLQGLKMENAVKQFDKDCKVLQTHKGTNCMFFSLEKRKGKVTGGLAQPPACENKG
jgi:hypothetical protein